MKLTLFFCAGIIHVETHTDDISAMAGIGKRMPVTMTAFGVAAAGMAGIPLVAGFVSKFYILVGSVEAGEVVFTAALLVSGVLNIAYFWPIVYQAFFESESPTGHDPKPLIENRYGGRPDVAADGGSGDGDGTDAPDEGPAGSGASTGEPDDPGYAVDRFPSDHSREDDAPDPAATGDGRSDEAPVIESGDHGHHGGPPAGGWERRSWRGGESTWFMLGPILFAAVGSLVLGIVPYAAVFLRLVRGIVDAATATAGVIA
jgi:NADH-quinone oxidoreductase subunit L/multicomponent Na+:H+ antiporter subunit D